MTNEELLKELQKLGYNDFIVPAGEYEVAAEVGDEGGAVKLAKDGRLIKKLDFNKTAHKKSKKWVLIHCVK